MIARFIPLMLTLITAVLLNISNAQAEGPVAQPQDNQQQPIVGTLETGQPVAAENPSAETGEKKAEEVKPSVHKRPIARREAHQQKRIAKGLESGRITANEAKHLEKGAARLEKNRQRAHADGKVTPKEHRKLERQANHQSRQIARAAHNNKTTHPAS